MDVDAWSNDDLPSVVSEGEILLNVQFSDTFKYALVKQSLNSVYLVQECCYKECKMYDVSETRDKQFVYRPSVTSLAEIRSGSSRRPVLFNGLPHRFGLVPDGHIKVFG